MGNTPEYRRAYQQTEKYKAWRRSYRKRTGNADSKRYEKTKSGFLMRAYRNMESRVRGIQKAKHHLYEGKTLLTRKEFYEWANNDVTFNKLFEAWKDAGHPMKLTPSVNRKNPQRGYEVDNMEWLTHSENSRLGSLRRNEIYGYTSKDRKI